MFQVLIYEDQIYKLKKNEIKINELILEKTQYCDFFELFKVNL